MIKTITREVFHFSYIVALLIDALWDILMAPPRVLDPVLVTSVSMASGYKTKI